MNIQILDLARDDLIEGFHFYERKEAGVGRQFLDSLYSDIERLAKFGGLHRKPYGIFHRALSKKYPFAFYYTVAGDTVQIRAVVTADEVPCGFGGISAGPNQRVEQNRRPAPRLRSRSVNLTGRRACVSTSPAAVAHPLRQSWIASMPILTDIWFRSSLEMEELHPFSMRLVVFVRSLVFS